jgi:rRNA processing protein Gar1
VFEDGMNDEVVATGNNNDWQDEVCESGSQNVGFVVHVLGDVVIRTSVDWKNEITEKKILKNENQINRMTYVPMIPSMA